MKGILEMAVFAFVTNSLHAATAAPSHAQLPTDLARAVTEFDRAQIKGDGHALARLLADDYVLVNSRAQLENKADFINDYTAPGWELMPYVVEDETIRQWDDGAILGGRVTLQGLSDSKPFKAGLRFADVWRKRDGHWQVVFTQAMRVVTP